MRVNKLVANTIAVKVEEEEGGLEPWPGPVQPTAAQQLPPHSQLKVGEYCSSTIDLCELARDY